MTVAVNTALNECHQQYDNCPAVVLISIEWPLNGLSVATHYTIYEPIIH